jgi:serine/threonine protein phosphatase PrpC
MNTCPEPEEQQQRAQMYSFAAIPSGSRASVYSLKNSRSSQQDAYVVRALTTDTLVCGVFDGHGRDGGAVANHLATCIVEALMRRSEPVTAHALTDAFAELDAGLPDDLLGGSTAVVVAVTPDEIVCANVGDSRAILVTGGEDGSGVIALSVDHSPNHPGEAKRVAAAGGFICEYGGGGDRVFDHDVGDMDYRRVSGLLAAGAINGGINMTRAFSRQMRDFGITATPDVVVVRRNPPQALTGSLVVVASDGVWDVLSSEHVARIVRHCYNHARAEGHPSDASVHIAARALVRVAIQNGSSDNVTAVVAVL